MEAVAGAEAVATVATAAMEAMEAMEATETTKRTQRLHPSRTHTTTTAYSMTTRMGMSATQRMLTAMQRVRSGPGFGSV